MEKEEVPRKYVDLDPLCTWSRENDCETLILYIPGFNTEQVTILIDTRRKLKVRGERKMQGEGNQWSRFSKDFTASKDCDLKGVHAHFDRGTELLSVTMPRLPPSSMAKLSLKAYVVIHYKLKKAWERLVRAVYCRIHVAGASAREGKKGHASNKEIKPAEAN